MGIMIKPFLVAKNKKCGYCLWKAENLYLLAESEEDAKIKFEQLGAGLCSDCIIEILIKSE